MEQNANQILQKPSVSILIPALLEAYSYSFEERPNYGKLKFLLQSILLNTDVAPDTKFSWISNQVTAGTALRSDISNEDLRPDEIDQANLDEGPTGFDTWKSKYKHDH